MKRNDCDNDKFKNHMTGKNLKNKPDTDETTWEMILRLGLVGVRPIQPSKQTPPIHRLVQMILQNTSILFDFQIHAQKISGSAARQSFR